MDPIQTGKFISLKADIQAIVGVLSTISFHSAWAVGIGSALSFM